MAQNERTRNMFYIVLYMLVIFHSSSCLDNLATIDGFVVESSSGAVHGGKSYEVESDTDLKLRLFGKEFTQSTSIAFTSRVEERGENCDDIRNTDPIDVSEVTEDPYSALVGIHLPNSYDTLMFCVKDRSKNSSVWIHQGNEEWLTIHVSKKPSRTTLLPLPVQIVLIFVLLLCSGLFSGLNLGLMSLDKTELKILQKSGTKREKAYAKVVASVRKRGNYLLCTILLGNVLVNNTLTILMDDLTGSGPIAVVVATAGIVVFGEIVPQAICSRYGLAIGAKTIWFTRFFMLLTFPLSFPISKILDCVLGEEMGSVYNRDRLRELLQESETDLKKDELEILKGALSFSKKTVLSIMTKIEDVYMLDISTDLDFDTVSDIMKTGYTRIPVYEKDKNNIVNILNIKDLAFIDPADCTPLSTVCKFYNHEVKFVFDDTTLDDMLGLFKKGQYHMAFVRKVINDGDCDPFYETLGVVTLEDVIEEIIQQEINDETDTILDNKSKARRQNPKSRTDFTQLKNESNNIRLPPQLLLATLQYLSTAVPAFKPDFISHGVLQKLLNQNVVFTLRFKDKDDTENNYLYMKNKPADYFILILQGRVEVDVGRDNMKFESGPFSYFGVPAIVVPGLLEVKKFAPHAGPLGPSSNLSKQQSISSLSTASDSLYLPRFQYVADFSVCATCDLQYLKIRRAHYVAAKRATAMARRHGNDDDANTPTDEAFQKEWSRAVSIDPEKLEAQKAVEDVSSNPPTYDAAADVDDVSIDVVVKDGSGVDNAPSMVGCDVRSRSMTSDSMDVEMGAHSPSTPLMALGKNNQGQDSHVTIEGAGNGDACAETSFKS